MLNLVEYIIFNDTWIYLLRHDVDFYRYKTERYLVDTCRPRPWWMEQVRAAGGEEGWGGGGRGSHSHTNAPSPVLHIGWPSQGEGSSHSLHIYHIKYYLVSWNFTFVKLFLNQFLIVIPDLLQNSFLFFWQTKFNLSVYLNNWILGKSTEIAKAVLIFKKIDCTLPLIKKKPLTIVISWVCF